MPLMPPCRCRYFRRRLIIAITPPPPPAMRRDAAQPLLPTRCRLLSEARICFHAAAAMPMPCFAMTLCERRAARLPPMLCTPISPDGAMPRAMPPYAVAAIFADAARFFDDAAIRRRRVYAADAATCTPAPIFRLADARPACRLLPPERRLPRAAQHTPPISEAPRCRYRACFDGALYTRCCRRLLTMPAFARDAACRVVRCHAPPPFDAHSLDAQRCHVATQRDMRLPRTRPRRCARRRVMRVLLALERCMRAAAATPARRRLHAHDARLPPRCHAMIARRHYAPTIAI